MAASFLTVVLTAASLGGADDPQARYMACLNTELESALARRIDGETFAGGVDGFCDAETTVYRRMAVASLVGRGMDGASPLAAGARFDTVDRGNRAELVSTFENRLRLRRGPARIAGLAPGRIVERD